MRPRRILGGLLVAFACLVACRIDAAWADGIASIGVRYGDHPGFGRIVLDLGDRMPPAFVRNGDTLLISAGNDVMLPTGAALPRNVRSISREADAIRVQLVPGASLHAMNMPNRLVFDFADATETMSARPVLPQAVPPVHPPRAITVAKASRPVEPLASSPNPSGPPMSLAAAAAIPVDIRELLVAKDPPSALPVAAPEGPKPVAPPPPMLMTSVVAVPAVPNDQLGHVLSLPFEPRVGAAALRRGQDALLVFDVRRPIDLSAVQNDPVFDGAEVHLLPSATVIQFHLPDQTDLRLRRSATGWVVTAVGGDVAAAPLVPIVISGDDSLKSDALLLSAQKPGGVISVPDPLSGGSLLVGTQLQAGEGIEALRRSPDFVLVPTWQGVAVQALSDAVNVGVVQAGFRIAAVGQGRELASSPLDAASMAAADASAMTRMFDFPNLPVNGLLRRLESRTVEAGQAPVQSRAGPRTRVAEAMITLGMGAEASAVLDIAIKDDARAAQDPTVVGLTAIGNLLSDHLDAASGLADRRLDGTDEIELWRAVGEALRRPGSSKAAAAFSATLPLLMNYPAPLRDRVIPLAAETMAQGGASEGLARLLTRFGADPKLDLARAMAMEAAKGDPAHALALYDQLALSTDRLVRVRAAERGAELRAANGLATPAQTADALGKLDLAWRDDRTDIDRRLREADLLTQAGQFRHALSLLREAEQVWPARKDSIHARLRSIFAAALDPKAQAALSSFELVALAEENADLIPDGEAGQALAERVSDRLTDLDLPERAVKLLERLAGAAPAGLARATFGGRLAAARLQLGDATGAMEALKASTAETLPAALLESRTLTFAAAVAAQHDLPSADRALLDLDTESGDRLMATLHEDAKDWPGAVAGWARVESRTIPAEGPLDEGQAATLVRLAGAAAQAGDLASLERLRRDDARRMPPGKITDTFNLLTARAVQSVSDLPRAAKDTALVKGVPAALSAMASLPAQPVAMH